MLKFDSLEIHGFKSFAEKTRVVFNERVTAVIGPNGCGKSNLADAIGWVLGIQTARSLRGQKMEDVIFNGTGKRKPSGLCQVRLSLRLTGDDPISVAGQEFSGEVLEISRKLFRSGESLYLINQRRCRLKEIHDLMEHTGLGFASYALIAQGQIESFLNSRPLERRAAIEEAARIVGYKSRRRSAELKLELARQNLVRVNDITLEVERQLRSLKRQAVRARRYKEIKEEFRKVQVQSLALESAELKRRLEDLQCRLEVIRDREEQMHSELEKQEEAHRDSTRRRDFLEGRLQSRRLRQSEVRVEVERAEQSIRHVQEQAESTRRQLAGSVRDRESIQAALEKLDEEVRRLKEERERLGGEADRAEEAVREARAAVELRDTEAGASEGGLEELRNRLLRLSGETASLRNLREQLEQSLKSLEAGHARLLREESEHRRRLEEVRSRLEEQRRVLEREKKDLGLLAERLASREQRMKARQQELERLREQGNELQGKVIAHRERLQSLQEVEINHSQYSQGVKEFLNHLSRSNRIRASGTLADSIETLPEYERLVEEFLDEELEYVLVGSLDEGLLGVSELKSVQGARCTFLSLRSSNGFGCNGRPSPALERGEGVHGFLSEILLMRPEVEEAFRRALPQQAESIVVSDLDRAMQLAHAHPETTFITLEAETLTPRGLVSGTAAQSRKLGLLGLKRQKRELEKRLAQLQKEHSRLEKVEQKCRKEIAELSELCAQDRRRLHQLEKEVVSLGHRKEQLELDLQRDAQALKVLQAEGRRLETEAEEGRRRLEDLRRRLEEKSRLQKETDRQLVSRRKDLTRIHRELAQARDRLHRLASDGKIIEERKAALEGTLSRLQEQREGLKGRREAALAFENESHERLRTFEKNLTEFRERLVLGRREGAAVEGALQELESEYADWKKSHPRLEEALSRLRDDRIRLQEERGHLEVEIARQETQLEHLSRLCREQHQQPLEKLVQEIDVSGLEVEEIRAAYDTLKARLEDFGPINMTALDEFQDNQERFEFLTRQREDIEKSIDDTTRAIQEINRRSRVKFREAFDAINGHFQELFQKLFDGGECGMQLLDEEDPLESGIDLFAQPPGKKLQNVMLLSGGEKALTVLALLMGIFMYRPSQFCILDEVDAPLDDANVSRFTRLLGEMCEKTQFILVTHNKRTMEIADTLYGVTMEEPGVSRLVSVQF